MQYIIHPYGRMSVFYVADCFKTAEDISLCFNNFLSATLFMSSNLYIFFQNKRAKHSVILLYLIKQKNNKNCCNWCILNNKNNNNSYK